MRIDSRPTTQSPKSQSQSHSLLRLDPVRLETGDPERTKEPQHGPVIRLDSNQTRAIEPKRGSPPGARVNNQVKTEAFLERLALMIFRLMSRPLFDSIELE